MTPFRKPSVRRSGRAPSRAQGFQAFVVRALVGLATVAALGPLHARGAPAPAPAPAPVHVPVPVSLEGAHAPEPAGEAAFVAGMAEVRALAEKRDWGAARDRLLELVGEHARRPYVVHRAEDVREELTRCAVRLAVPKPDPKSLVSGRLVGHDASRGSIHLMYRPDELEDFERAGDFLVHPIDFAGSHTVLIRGRSYRGSPIVAVGLEEDRARQVVFGSYRSESGVESWTPAVMIQSRGDASETLDEIEKPERLSEGEPFELEVTVTSTRVIATYNGRRWLAAAKEPDHFGRIGFANVESFDELEIRGVAGNAWLQGLVDAATRQAEAEFLATWSPDRVLPPWLRTERSDGPASEGGGDALPWTVSGDEIAHADRIGALVEAGRHEEALAELAGLESGALPTDVRTYFELVAHVGLESWHRALELASKLAARNPDFVSGRVLHAMLHARVGSRRAAIGELRAAIRLDPRRLEAYSALAEQYLLEGDLPRARETILDARRAGLRGEPLDDLEAVMVKAARGPNWDRRYSIETEHYRIVTDIDRTTCVEAGRELEAAWQRCARELGPLGEAAGRSKSRVFLFSGQAGYEAYLSGLFETAMQSTAGMYSYSLKQLLVWNLPARERMMATIRHEAVHQYLDAAGADPPTWFNEGLAEYLSVRGPLSSENANANANESANANANANRTAKAGGDVPSLDPSALRTLRRQRNRLVPMREFLYLEGAAFYRDMNLHYAQAWSIVHFLRHGGPEMRAIHDALLAGSRGGVGKKACVDRAFEGVDLDTFTRRWLAWIDALAE